LALRKQFDESVGTTSLDNVSVDGTLRRRGAMKKQAVVESALEVVENALRSSEMGSTRVVHVKTVMNRG
jgi:hypothetical protein